MNSDRKYSSTALEVSRSDMPAIQSEPGVEPVPRASVRATATRRDRVSPGLLARNRAPVNAVPVPSDAGCPDETGCAAAASGIAANTQTSNNARERRGTGCGNLVTSPRSAMSHIQKRKRPLSIA